MAPDPNQPTPPMIMNKYILTLTLLLISTFTWADYGLHFDDSGEIIRPDEYYLGEALSDDKDGFRDAAITNFKKSAEYGNYVAMTMLGFYHLQNKELVQALAWFEMIDQDKVPNSQQIKDLAGNITSVLTPAEYQQVKNLKAQLAETYGAYPTLVKREQWKKSLKFTGTNLRGYIPPFLRIELNSGVTVSGFEVRNQVNEFIYEYEFGVPTGEVIMNEVEVLETEATESDADQQDQ